jgi:hypothetical protein
MDGFDNCTSRKMWSDVAVLLTFEGTSSPLRIFICALSNSFCGVVGSIFDHPPNARTSWLRASLDGRLRLRHCRYRGDSEQVRRVHLACSLAI